MNHIHSPLFMINNVNVTLIRQFQFFYCLFKGIICLNHDVFLISLLFRIISSLNHIHLHLFMIVKVNVTQLRPFLGLYFLTKLIIRLIFNVFLLSLLFRIVSSLNNIRLPLFMINKGNFTQIRRFLGLFCFSKRIIRLTQYVFLISLLFMIVSSLNHIHLPLFMINNVNVAF